MCDVETSETDDSFSDHADDNAIICYGQDHSMTERPVVSPSVRYSPRTNVSTSEGASPQYENLGVFCQGQCKDLPTQALSLRNTRLLVKPWTDNRQSNFAKGRRQRERETRTQPTK